MSDLKLVIGDKNSSTWSLCAWLTLKQLGLEFEEVVVARHLPDARERILQHSLSGKLPLLVVGEIKVWDSLAINEFLADHFDGLWPVGAAARAVARSVAAEAHSGFRDLHTFLPMDVTARFGPPGRLLAGVAADVRRLAAIWHDCRGRFGEGGPFLVGEFSIADAMMAPVCAKLMTYAVPLDELCREYVGQVVSLPAMLEWAEGAAAEVDPTAAPSTAGAGLPRPAMPAVAARPSPAVEDDDEATADEEPPPEEAAPEEAAPEEVVPEADETDDDDGPPAPGLPGVVATRRYTGERETGPAREMDMLPRRLVRPPVPSGLVPRRPSPVMAEPPHRSEPPLPARDAVTAKPLAAAPAPWPVAPPPPALPAAAAARSPAETSPRPPLPPAVRRPEPPPARPAAPGAPQDPRELARGAATPPSAQPATPVAVTPEIPRAEGAPAEPEAPLPPVRPAATLPAATRPAFRPETIKPIGTGTRRRR